MELRGKTILIISPNYWGNMMVSKHHYAEELAKRGNMVYFLNPPDLKRKYFELEQIGNNLYQINYRPIFRAKKYLPGFLFDFLIWIQVKYLLKKIMHPFDIIWSFDSSIYLQLNWFKTKLTIFFIADNNNNKAHKIIAKRVNLILSVSKSLIDELSENQDKSYFINHGLSNDFVQAATEKLNNLTQIISSKKDRIKVGYIGNLLIKSLDIEVCKKLVNSNNQVEFTFYGAYQLNQSNLSGYNTDETFNFIEFLKQQENVVLKGGVSPSILVKELTDYDAFLILINPETDYNKGANSHKAIEYLSTGKVIISNKLSTYMGKIGLIEMVDEMHNENLPALFQKVIANLEYYNSPELQKRRIEFALDNTYEMQIRRIEAFINNVT